MVMREVSLGRLEQLVLGVPRELRPPLAKGNPTVPLNIASRGLLPGVQAAWLEPHRRELAEIRLESLEVIGRAGLNLGGGQISSVERAARALIETEPYRESGYILLMGALEAQGNMAEGLRVFDRLRGLPLPPEIRGRAASPLVGRRDERKQLQSWLAELGSERVLMLFGEAGIGKSRLLDETARQAHAAGATVLAGRAPEETLVPYQPFLEAIGHDVFNAPLEELRAVTRHSGADLGRPRDPPPAGACVPAHPARTGRSRDRSLPAVRGRRRACAMSGWCASSRFGASPSSAPWRDPAGRERGARGPASRWWPAGPSLWPACAAG